MHAVGRIAYRGWIDNIQASWVKVGVHGARQLLLAGCNDLGGTLMDENISRAAGANHGQELDDDDFRSIVDAARAPARAAHHALRPHARPSAGGSGRDDARAARRRSTRPPVHDHHPGPGRMSVEGTPRHAPSTSSGSGTRSSTC